MQNNTMNGVSSDAVTPQINYNNIIQNLEKEIVQDVKNVALLQQLGTLPPNEGQNLSCILNDSLNKLNALKQGIFSSAPISEPAAPQINPFDLFNRDNPGFFEKDGRKDVLDYIKNLEMDKDEIAKIAKMVENLEKSAVDSYLKNAAHEKTLNDENAAAKSKLTSYAQNAVYDSNNNRVFTREDIGRMSGDEFVKNEKLIMEQVKQGLIK